jgi:UDP-N-acetylmuramyl tripeptide synthase
VVVLLNLVRDQLDRYGEIDAISERWIEDLRALPPDAQIVVCGDDPRVEAIARSSGRPVRRFGLVRPVDRPHARQAEHDVVQDPPPCPRCGARLDGIVPGSNASWHCAACGLDPSPLDLAVGIDHVDPAGWLYLAFSGPALRSGTASVPPVRVRLTGSAAAYDAAAAALAAMAVGIDPLVAIRSLDGATPAFGRLEEMAVADRRVVLTLAKNPASLAQAATAVEVRRPDGLLIALGDRPADGRDVSWIWDATLDRLPAFAPTTLAGDRADDLALRLKYGVDSPTDPKQAPLVERRLERALDMSLDRIRPGGTLMVLATYTPLLGIRKVLERRGLASTMPR